VSRKKSGKPSRKKESRFIRPVVAVTPTATEAQIDLDTRADLKLFRKQWLILKSRCKMYGFHCRWKYRISRSRNGGWHVTLTWGKRLMGAEERIALQACLGSDRVRELLSLIRWWAGSRHPTLFFEERKRGRKNADH